MTHTADIRLKLKTFYLQNTNSDKYCTLLTIVFININSIRNVNSIIIYSIFILSIIYINIHLKSNCIVCIIVIFR